MHDGVRYRRLHHRGARTAESLRAILCQAWRSAEGLRERPAAPPWLSAQVVPVNVQNVERIQERVPGALTAYGSSKPREVGHAIRATDHAFAVDGNRGHAECEHGINDTRDPVCPVIPAP